MASIEFIYLCDHAFLDQQGQPCLIGIKDTLVAPTFPYHRAALSAAVMLRSAESTKIELWFGHSDGSLLRRVPLDVNVQAPGQIRTFLPIQMVQVFFPRAGEYEAKIIEKGEVVGAHRIRVISFDSRRQTPTENRSSAGEADRD